MRPQHRWLSNTFPCALNCYAFIPFLSVNKYKSQTRIRSPSSKLHSKPFSNNQSYLTLNTTKKSNPITEPHDLVISLHQSTRSATIQKNKCLYWPTNISGVPQTTLIELHLLALAYDVHENPLPPSSHGMVKTQIHL